MRDGLHLNLILAAGLCLALTACDAGPSAIPARDHSKAAAPVLPAEPTLPAATVEAPVETHRAAPVRRVDGKPIWSSNRSRTAEENARSHFERNGAAFGARTLDEFVAKAHAFTSKPPPGTLRLSRPNGDRLLYDPRTNVFAVVTREGAPRTMFKPDDGMAYWERQKRIEAGREGKRGG